MEALGQCWPCGCLEEELLLQVELYPHMAQDRSTPAPEIWLNWCGVKGVEVRANEEPDYPRLCTARVMGSVEASGQRNAGV